MIRKIAVILAAGVLIFSLAGARGQNPGAQAQNPSEKKPQAQEPAGSPVAQLAEAMAKRLGDELHVRTVVGEPIKAGAVTLIPIMMIDIGFGGGQGGMPNGPMGGSGFYMRGEARPLGFVAITKKGTRFISVGKTPQK